MVQMGLTTGTTGGRERNSSRETDEERMLRCLLLLLHGAPGMISRRIKIIGSEILRQSSADHIQTSQPDQPDTSRTHSTVEIATASKPE